MSQIIYKDRTNANSRKFRRDDLIPLWIADMDFEVPKCVTDGVREYIDFGVFGYYDPTDEYFNAIIDWEEKYQNYQIKKLPKELSGGMKQRCAIAQAFSIDPPILLMDKPFGALDAVTRAKLQDLVKLLWTKQEVKKLYSL